MPVAATVKVASVPELTTWVAGGVVMEAAPFTVRVAGAEVMEPALLETRTE